MQARVAFSHVVCKETFVLIGRADIKGTVTTIDAQASCSRARRAGLDEDMVRPALARAAPAVDRAARRPHTPNSHGGLL